MSSGTAGAHFELAAATLPRQEIGRPSGIVFDQIDGDLGGILAFMDELFAL